MTFALQTEDLSQLQASSVIWEKCFRERLCIKIPFDGKKCTPYAEGCVRILTEGGKFYVVVPEKHL